jgi:N-acetyl-alpha-D-glucosaminyl L-malate synthase BshA
VIPNFINTEEYKKPTPCDKHSIAKEDELVFIHISNFRKVKRIQDVIEIFDRVQQEVPAKLLMLGDGPEKVVAEKLVVEKKISNKVQFLGNVTCVPSLLSIADIFLLPSEQESFGLSALEAFAAGCPVISSNAGGLPEVNQHGKTGFLSTVRDVKDMSENALYLAKNPDVLKQFKQNAKERSKDFEIDKILPLYKAVYQKILGKQ